MRFVGIDLAWGERATTAVAVLQTGETDGEDGKSSAVSLVAWHDSLLTDDEILAFVDGNDAGGAVWVGIDAPIFVPNAAGSRPCDRALGSLMGRFHAGPHPANRTLLARADGTVRGETLANALKTRGFVADREPENVSRAVFEVFPHPAHVALFDLATILPYKAKSGRAPAALADSLLDYATRLESLSDPKIDFGPSWETPTPESLRGARRKRFEDLLDSVTCAYVAAFRFHHGSARCPSVVGDGAWTDGAIVTPLPPSVLKKLIF